MTEVGCSIRVMLFCLVAMFATREVPAAVASAELQRLARSATFEVVVRKPEKDLFSYEKPLPLELIPFTERNDKYWSLGTAFAIEPGTFVSAGHVMTAALGSRFGAPSIRDGQGNVYQIDRVVKYSRHEDFMVFTVKNPPHTEPFLSNTAPAVDDSVFAVGNALGDGVVIRDGLLTSLTPEDQDGRWKWLRFSAAASPGNSGGPLLNAEGKVLGVVIARSPGENLNFALPIDQVLKNAGKQADIDMRLSFALPMLKQTSVAQYKASFPLPLPYEDFARRLLASQLSEYTAQRERLLREQGAELFPRGNTAKLFAATNFPDGASLIRQNDEHAWEIDTGAASEEAVDLPGDGWVRATQVGGVVLVRLHRSNDASDDAFYGDPKASMDQLVKGLKISRPVGSQSVRVTSLGTPAHDAVVVDRFGRKWQSRLWSFSYMDLNLHLLVLPLPDGYAGMVRYTNSEGSAIAADELQMLADYFVSPYAGTPQQWQGFLRRRNLLPAAFEKLNLRVDAAAVELDSPRLKAKLTPALQRFEVGTSLRLDMLPLLDRGQLTWDLGGVTLFKDDSGESFIGAYRRTQPQAEAGRESAQRWAHLVAGDGEFSGRLQRDQDLKTISFRTRARGLRDAAKGPAPSVLYELMLRTNAPLMPRDVDGLQTQMLDAFEVREQ